MNVYEKYRFSLRKNSVFRVASVLNQAKGIDAFMKLINVDEECPEIFYVFIGLGSSIYSKINYHNYKLNNLLVSGGFKNLEISNIDINDFIKGNVIYAPFVPNPTPFYSPTSHLMNVINSYQVEYILEFYRKKEYPSRFSCLYAFGDYESCEKANKLYPKMFDLSKVKIQVGTTVVTPTITWKQESNESKQIIYKMTLTNIISDGELKVVFEDGFVTDIATNNNQKNNISWKQFSVTLSVWAQQ